MKFGRQMLNHVEKNSKYYCKKYLAVYNGLPNWYREKAIPRFHGSTVVPLNTTVGGPSASIMICRLAEWHSLVAVIYCDSLWF